jgi:beta-glucanase (GH16 family)
MRFTRTRLVSAISCAALMALGFAAHGQDKPGWKLVWSDEFNGPNIDNTKWSINNGPANVNQELEYYSNRSNNVFIQNGCLVLRAIKEDFGGKNYTSGKMTSAGKGDWLYGRFEVRAKLNKGQGMWPAIWMMPTDGAYGGWPSSGEMDIMELLGHQPNRVYGTIHWATNGAHQQSGSSFSLKTGTFADTFHVFAYEWEAGKQRWYVDDSLYFSTARGQPFDKRFFYILNVAVGGSWPGNPDNTTTFPNDMLVDYARVYEKSNSAAVLEHGPQGLSLSLNYFQNGATLTNGKAESEISLLDLSGRVMQQQRLSAKEKCDVGAKLPDGVYVLEVSSGGRMQTQKLIKSGKAFGRAF